jgi:hypothetical protein
MIITKNIKKNTINKTKIQYHKKYNVIFVIQYLEKTIYIDTNNHISVNLICFDNLYILTLQSQ